MSGMTVQQHSKQHPMTDPSVARRMVIMDCPCAAESSCDWPSGDHISIRSPVTRMVRWRMEEHEYE